MIPLTIVVSLIAVGLALWAKPPLALALLICGLMLYPEYLRIPLGPVKMSVPRLAGLALLIRLTSTARQRGFRWRLIDKLICFEWVWTVAACVIMGAETNQRNEMIGRIFDMPLMYFVARLCLVRAQDYRKVVWPLAGCALIAGSLGVVEAVTHHSPYEVLRSQSLIGIEGFSFDDGPAEYRFGLARAAGATSMSIYFGIAMLLLMGMLYSARGFAHNTYIWMCGCLAALLGALSSMSSGPQSAVATFIICSLFYWMPRMIKPALLALVALAIFCECTAHRHFWYLIEYLNPAGGDYWYRCQLITVAITHWRDYGLIGVGSNTPNYWGMLIDERIFVDVVNEYVVVALRAGLIGLACRLAIQGLAIYEAVSVYRTGNKQLRQLAFGQVATLLACVVGAMSVGAFGAPLILSYLLLGMMVRRPLDQVAPACAPKSTNAKGRLTRPRSAYLPAATGDEPIHNTPVQSQGMVWNHR